SCIRLQPISTLFPYTTLFRSINFDELAGIVGIFGPNASGKSSIPGALLYTLYNGSDRGPLKNIHICNTRKSSCVGRAIFNVNGVDRKSTRLNSSHVKISYAVF